MEKHFLLTGFSCTGKTFFGKKAFGNGNILDSDDEICKLINQILDKRFEHIYEIYMAVGRDAAIRLIEAAEETIIGMWAITRNPMIISLGPGFPLRCNWLRLREVSFVVLFTKSPQAIYDGLKVRREEIFSKCPEARNHDNWDTGVMVDERRVTYSKADSIAKITTLLSERERYYRINDKEIQTDGKVEKIVEELKKFKQEFKSQ
jgi:shikimate kinase